MRRAISVPNVDDPAELVRLGCDADAAGWDGYFLWDHVQVYAAARFDVHDPWLVLAAVAQRTDRIRLGAMVTPPGRRRPWQLGKQIVTLDHLSAGRVVVGIGLGFPADDEFGAFGEATDPVERAARTDEAMEIVDRILRGEPVDHDGRFFTVQAHLLPAAVQRPRPPIWVAATPPYRRPLERAARWDGVYCNVKVDGDLTPLRPAELAEYLGPLVADPAFDVVTSPHPEHGPDEYEAVGVTWLVETSWPGPGWLEQFRQRIGLG